MASGVAGCTSISYYAKSLEGHVQIMAARKNVGTLIKDPATPGALRAKLQSASAIRRYATEALALPDNSSYRSYVDIGREAVAWAVFAAPQFSLTPRTWCFPVFGCVPYRGYFDRKEAAENAVALQKEGFDVHVTGVTAYSTLGWSSDPLLSTMLGPDDTFLASLIFHELAHQRLYVKGDSAFNEAFAVAVETSGVRKWLRAGGDLAGLRRYEADRRRRADFLGLLATTREELQQVYQSARTPEQKAAAKAATIETLRARYRLMRDRRWAGYRAMTAGSRPRSTTPSSPPPPSMANRCRHSCVCSISAPATIRGSTPPCSGSGTCRSLPAATRLRLQSRAVDPGGRNRQHFVQARVPF